MVKIGLPGGGNVSCFPIGAWKPGPQPTGSVHVCAGEATSSLTGAYYVSGTPRYVCIFNHNPMESVGTF